DAFASYQCHCADLGNGITVCLVTLFQESPDTLKSAPSFVLTALEEGREMRMFLIQGDKAHFVCSKRLNGNLSDALYKLYRLAKQNEMSDSLFLDDETRSVLDSLIGPNARAASDLF
ncbi:MAG: hypothetical protein IJK52_03310, partial [Oscillospiraceae bacterium]|nr:hypothetical protein [Oscillospiraceae bacterium]